VIDPVDYLCWASAAGALIGAGAYIYGYIIKSRGDRRLHTASLLFTGFGLANLPLVLRNGATGAGFFSGAVLVTFLLLGLVCQAATAFRGRRADRRATDPTLDRRRPAPERQAA
jgi:hypothetical protein